MRLGFLLAAVALPGVMLAAAAPAATKAAPSRSATPAAPEPMALTPGAKRINLSPEGRAIASKIMGAPDPRLPQLQAEMATLRQEKLQFIAGPTVDVAKLEPLLRREEALQAEFRTKQNDRLIALLKALPDPDRLALLQTLANPPKPQSSKPVDTGR